MILTFRQRLSPPHFNNMKSLFKQFHILLIATFVLSIYIACSGSVNAQSVSYEDLPDLKIYNDFVVGPGKIEIDIEPGQSQVINLTVSNRLGTDRVFSIGEEDFVGSDDPAQTVVLLGDDRGPYSLKDYIQAATTTILIPHGKRIRVPVQISIPADAQPGGLYGSLVVGTVSKSTSNSDSDGAVAVSPVITRIGTLFFIRVAGDVRPEGKLEGFSLSGKKSLLWDNSPVRFDLLFRNTGNVHIDPAGTIVVTNMMGSPVGNLEIDPWFAMPQSLRFRQVEWTPPFMFGRYVAEATIVRGYGSTTDTMRLVFWVIPWKVILIILFVISALIGGYKFIRSKFKIVRKKNSR